MRVLLAALALSTVVALSGCNEGTPGGPGATTTDNTSTTTSGEDTTPVDSSTDVAPANSPTNTGGETPATSVTTPDATTPDATSPDAATPKTTTENPLVDADNTFRLDLPNLTTEIKQGESQVVSVGITRQDNFDQDVALEFQDLPKGVVIEPEKASIKAGEKEAQITLKAAKDAALGDFTINVIGKPTKGANATNKLNITVEQP